MSNTNIVSIKGLVITPPVLGRISIGHMEERAGGKRIPVKDDQFTITSQVQVARSWVPHPMDEKLRGGKDRAETKLRSIPVRLMFDDPALNMRAEFTCFDTKTGRALCCGDGAAAKRLNYTEGKVEDVECIPGACEFGEKNRCKPYGRLNLQIEGQDDELGTFMFRTTGFNSIRTLAARLQYLRGIANGQLAGMPLDLVIRGKSTTQSMGSAIFYVDLVVRQGMKLSQAVAEARQFHQEWEDAGMSRDAFEEAARQGILNGLFEDSPEELPSVLEEFFSEIEGEKSGTMDTSALGESAGGLDGLRDVLDSVENAEASLPVAQPEAPEHTLFDPEEQAAA